MAIVEPVAEPGVLTSQVARLFFQSQLTKVEIARRLGMSRFRVARMIDEALTAGLVEIHFRDTMALEPELARALELRFGLDLCVVAKAASTSGADRLELARVASLVLADLLRQDEVLGVAWGSTIAGLAASMVPHQVPAVRVVQLSGGSMRIARDENPSEVARRLADRLGAAYHPLYAPAFVESVDLRDALVREPDLRETIDLFDRITLAVVGIGAYGPGSSGEHRSALIASGVLGPEDVRMMREEGAVGDLILYPFALDGRFVAASVASRAVAIAVEQLRRVPRVMAVAGGAPKADAIRGALATGIVKILVTDEHAARAILSEPTGGQDRVKRGAALPRVRAKTRSARHD